MNQTEKEEIARLKRQVVDLGMKLQARNEDVKSWRSKHGQAQNRILELSKKVEKSENLVAKLRKELALAIARAHARESKEEQNRAELRRKKTEYERRDAWLSDFISKVEKRNLDFSWVDK